MDIQIPLAEQDTGTEGHPTDRSLTQTVSDGWSREGQASSLTSRSLAPSGVSQALSSHTAVEDKADADVCTGNDLNEPASGDDTQGDEHTRIPLKSPGTERDNENNFSEDTYRSTRLAAEEATDRYLAALSSADSQEGEQESVTTMETAEESAAADSEAKNTETESEQKTEEIGADDEQAEVEPSSTEQNEDDTSNGAQYEETSEANNENVIDIDQENSENEESTLAENSSNKSDDNDNTEQPGTDSKTVDHNSGSGFTAEAGDAETPRNPQDLEQNQDEIPAEEFDKLEDTQKGVFLIENAQQQNQDNEIPAEESNKLEDTQKGVFLTENARQEDQDDGSDISDVRANTPNWDEEGAENDAASLSDGGGVSQKPGRSSARSRMRPLTRSTMHGEVAPGRRAVVNTPVSFLTATDFHAEVIRNVESRNTSHAGQDTAREAAFQRAMTLMTTRCDDKDAAVDAGGVYSKAIDGTYGPKCPQYFYVQQCTPKPMAPLKAWRGYHGNIYFEPMNIHKVRGGKRADSAADSYATRKPTPSCKSASSRRTRTMTPASRSRALVPVSNGDEGSVVTTGEGQINPSRSTTRQTIKRGPTSAKSRTSSRSVAAISQHHVLYLDKQVVIRQDNSAIHEELDVIEKQQATGSLNVHSRRHFPQDLRARVGRSGASSAKFDRICRGSVAHTLRRAKSGGPLGNSMSRSVPQQQQQQQQRPRNQKNTYPALGSKSHTELIIVGDKFAPAAAMSPLLRTQTQFSQSSQRVTVNSPDLYGAFERLPPLEQVRISLRQMDASGDDSLAARVSTPYTFGSNVGVVELKPFIKYSPDVKAQYNRQIKFD
ncbi:uncharacterized protein [Littorina saxatilis]|uniref:Uncharacterized protein n=1 Tax=Littorina saxatilis TaxID=31220 RepID=A0AAN9G6M5_9CAEN